MTGLTFDEVTCVRGGRFLFGDVSFALEPGDALIVTGANGVGKSSMLRLAAGLLTAERGTVRRNGNCALADEHLALDPTKTLHGAMRFWAALDGSSASAALDAVGLMALSQVPVRMLSTGQRRRATLARVIAARTEIWLLDEPANGLDNEASTILEGSIAAHRIQGGIVVVASHQPITVDGARTLALT